MRLSCEKTGLWALTRSLLIEAIIERRKVIRYHRDQIADERCFLDDDLVHQMLDDTPSLELPKNPEGKMALCEEFYKYRRSHEPDKNPFFLFRFWFRGNWDLYFKSRYRLLLELNMLQVQIKRHRDVPVKRQRPRLVRDDRMLYQILPDRLSADFRLPPVEDFLGQGKAPVAGCPSFWASHRNCRAQCHNWHKWGPCL